MTTTGYGMTFTSGQPVPRYYDRLLGGWVRLFGSALIHNGHKP